ncbi:hypothetical protein DE146DRAFT_184365 [Phaeosphaeria sp. MPI-PUGE-AT-0046c]|nr:hypothetical protein DE146DRAFT_184365 [Phaeosphaeria sp. MPI-PUGE-AT-0046c]
MATSQHQDESLAAVPVIEEPIDDRLTPLPSPPQSPEIARTRSPAIHPKAENHGPQTVQGWSKREFHKWQPPFYMTVFFLVGFSMSIAHCIFYPKLRGKLVGDSYQQEEKLRFGTAFAFLAQICLSASVWIAHTQWMWRTVKQRGKTALTVEAWNCVIGADTSVFAVLNPEMLRELRLASAMALFAWSLLLPPFFTPATLFIYNDINIVKVSGMMPYPAIANVGEAHRFSYSPPTQRGRTQNRDDNSRVFTGPRTALNLVTAATSSLGEILQADLPYNNSAYSISFYAPIVKCSDADETHAGHIQQFVDDGIATTYDDRKEVDSAYYSFVPTYNSGGNLTAVWHPRQQTPSRPINELWMSFMRSKINDSGERVKLRHYQICKPHKASYNLHISQYHGVQTISGNYTIGNTVPFPSDAPDKTSDMVQHAYTAFMWTICDQLVGKFAWFTSTASANTTSQAAAQFGVIESPIQRTSLLGSRDFDAFYDMDEERGLYINQRPDSIFDLSDQRLRDKALARNRTLDVLIEELSFNTTVSLMHNRLFT